MKITLRLDARAKRYYGISFDEPPDLTFDLLPAGMHPVPGFVSLAHIVAAEQWDNDIECLKWAAENGATVAEMKAWRRAQRGEDLTIPEGEGV